MIEQKWQLRHWRGVIRALQNFGVKFVLPCIYINNKLRCKSIVFSKMQNEKARTGCRHVLAKLDEPELIALASTVTQGLLKNKVTTSQGAIDAILRYSPDVRGLLKRKSITRDILFEYIHECGITVSLPVTKPDLTDIICEHWNERPSVLRLQAPEPRHQLPAPEPRLQLPTPEPRSEVQSNNARPTPEPGTAQLMAVKFAEWFYTMMNQDEPIGTEHFWQDAKLQLKMTSGLEEIVKTIDSDVNSLVSELYKVKKDHGLYFYPNLLTDGVQGRMDSHGLVIVMACGTLHTADTCVGVFDQMFMLVRDPLSDDNWKVKNTKLQLKSRNDIPGPPKLTDCGLDISLASLTSLNGK